MKIFSLFKDIGLDWTTKIERVDCWEILILFVHTFSEILDKVIFSVFRDIRPDFSLVKVFRMLEEVSGWLEKLVLGSSSSKMLFKETPTVVNVWKLFKILFWEFILKF